MIIDFAKIEENGIPGFKGGQGSAALKIYSDDLTKIIRGRLVPGSSIGFHSHDTNSEMIYIISGKADFLYDDGKESVEAGGCHFCPKGHSHSMINNGNEDLVFFAVVPEQ